jgi:drug/metabolite transporter (DMT)-like permease
MSSLFASGQPPLLLLVAAWWVSAIFAVITSKVCLSHGLQPMHLCAAQFLSGAVLCRLALVLRHKSHAMSGDAALVHGIAITYAAAFMCTNVAFSLSSTPFVETIKAAEPLSTCLLAALWLREFDRPVAYLALLPIMLGVGLASHSADSAYRRDALLATLASNFGFSARAVLAKRIRRERPHSPCARSDLVLFYHVSRLGLLFMLPLVAVHDAYRAMAGSAAPLQPSTLPAGTLALMSIANGACFTIYNGASFAVLSRVSANSHAVLNLLRRVVIITTSAAFFSIHVSVANGAGIAVALAGGLLYVRAKQAPVAGGRLLDTALSSTPRFDKLRIV